MVVKDGVLRKLIDIDNYISTDYNNDYNVGHWLYFAFNGSKDIDVLGAFIPFEYIRSVESVTHGSSADPYFYDDATARIDEQGYLVSAYWLSNDGVTLNKLHESDDTKFNSFSESHHLMISKYKDSNIIVKVLNGDRFEEVKRIPIV